MSETKVAEVEAPKKLAERDFRWEEAFFAYGYAYATLPVGWAFEECLKPEFWVNVVRHFKANPMTGSGDRAGSKIEVRSEDHAFIGYLYVRAVLSGGLLVECIGPNVDAKGNACLPRYLGEKVEKIVGYDVKWNVGKRKFDIVRQIDGEIVGDAPTKELAAGWIARTTGTMKAA